MNSPIGIILLIAGVLLLFICGSTYLSTISSIKNQAAWDKFYDEAQKKIPQISEEELYRLICQLNTASC